jgi:hypothetical protein
MAPKKKAATSASKNSQPREKPAKRGRATPKAKARATAPAKAKAKAATKPAAKTKIVRNSTATKRRTATKAARGLAGAAKKTTAPRSPKKVSVSQPRTAVAKARKGKPRAAVAKAPPGKAPAIQRRDRYAAGFRSVSGYADSSGNVAFLGSPQTNDDLGEALGEGALGKEAVERMTSGEADAEGEERGTDASKPKDEPFPTT